jgi:hypothetical protein
LLESVVVLFELFDVAKLLGLEVLFELVVLLELAMLLGLVAEELP